MLITQKSQYGLRAMFELAGNRGKGAMKIVDIARAQAIPPRFLETILPLLKDAGYLKSHRGAHGGYVIARGPETISALEIIETLQGSLDLVSCVNAEGKCALDSRCTFISMWRQSRAAMETVLKNTSLKDLMERARYSAFVSDYSI